MTGSRAATDASSTARRSAQGRNDGQRVTFHTFPGGGMMGCRERRARYEQQLRALRNRGFGHMLLRKGILEFGVWIGGCPDGDDPGPRVFRHWTECPNPCRELTRRRSCGRRGWCCLWRVSVAPIWKDGEDLASVGSSERQGASPPSPHNGARDLVLLRCAPHNKRMKWTAAVLRTPTLHLSRAPLGGTPSAGARIESAGYLYAGFDPQLRIHRRCRPWACPRLT